METNVSTKVMKIDLKTILENYREPEFWNKEWEILKTYQMSIVWRITNINTLSNLIESEVIAKRVNVLIDGENVHRHWWVTEDYHLASIPCNNPEYTEEHFKKALYGAVVRLLNAVEDHCVWYYDDYTEYERLRDDYMDKIKHEALRYYYEKDLDPNLKESFIDMYIAEQPTPYSGLDVTNHYRYHVIPDTYKFAANWFDMQEDIEKYSSMDMSIKGPYVKEVKF